ncbi:hypothetical protein KJZ63_02600 [Patescibacteria group bacterium]|nr:hypothetical protein [Patescibacteria group bacterium]
MDPFAKALQSQSKARTGYKAPTLSPELEKNFNSQNLPQNSGLNPFSEALARTGGKSVADFGNFNQNMSEQDMERQQEELLKKQKKEALRQKLHKEINPVDLSELYSAGERRTKKQLEEVRKELRMFALEVTKLYKEVDVALFQEVVNPGQTGVGLRAYFDKLREFIKLLRQKVHSARTWLNVQSNKSKKKRAAKGNNRTGIEISGQSHEQTKAVFDQMHHEQSSSYTGG